MTLKEFVTMPFLLIEKLQLVNIFLPIPGREKLTFLKVMFVKKNELLLINPGAAGRHGFHKKRTMIRFKISKSGLSDMEIIELGERGKLS